MNDDVLSLILDNARDLLGSSKILKENNKLSHAGHFAVYSIEECAKYLMKTPAIQPLFKDKDICNHFRKEDAILYIWAILGKLSVVYTLESISNSDIGDQGWRNSTKKLADLLALEVTDLHGESSQERFANINAQRSKLKVNKEYKFDKIRKNTVYANPDTGKVDTVNAQELEKCIEFADFVVELISMINTRDFCWKRFFEIAPAEITNEMTASAGSLLDKVKAEK